MSRPRAERPLTHGLYTKVLTREEKAKIGKVRATNIRGEIQYLRVICSRLAKIVNENGLKAGEVKPLTDATLKTLNALDLKLNTLLRYVRTEAYLNGEPTEYDRQIEEGEFIARKRRNVFNYLRAGEKAPASDRPSGMGDDTAGAIHPLDRGRGPEAVSEGAVEAHPGVD
jgi:hypothetical protein